MLPPVPSVAPGYRAPQVAAERRAHHRRHAAAVRRHLAARRDRDGAAQESEPGRLGVEFPSRALQHRTKRKARTTSRCTWNRNRTFPSIRRSKLSRGRSRRTRQLRCRAGPDAGSRQHHPAPVGLRVRRQRTDRERHEPIRPTSSRAAPITTRVFNAFNPYYLGDAEPRRHPAAAQELRHECGETSVEARDHQCRRRRRADADRRLEYDLTGRRQPIGISSPLGATSRSKKRRSAKRSPSSRATFGSRSAAPRRPSMRSSRKRRFRTSKMRSFRRCRRVSQLQNQLKSLVAANAHDPIWEANLVPSTSVEQLPSAHDLATVVAAAQQNRPEVRQAEDRRLQADIDRAFAKNQSLPQADVQVQYESNGFAGLLTPRSDLYSERFANGNRPVRLCPTPPPNTQGTMAFAYHNMWAGYFPTLTSR